jgi:hypothetical protein
MTCEAYVIFSVGNLKRELYSSILMGHPLITQVIGTSRIVSSILRCT